MSWLLFLDESGHDHKQMPYEVRGGIVLHASELWPFVQAMQRLELDCFGGELTQYGKELKGSTLLDKKRFRLASQDPNPIPNDARRKHCRGFLTKGLEHKKPTRDEFTSYGQACILMAEGIFQLLHGHKAALFATVIPARVAKPATYEAAEYLRKDHVFLLERYFYFLEAKRDHGLLVMDEVDKTEDRRFVKRLERYFSKTAKGRYRSTWIVPTPFFVSSELTYAIQAADLCIYCINWGFRLSSLGMNERRREEIAGRFGYWLDLLQYRGQSYEDGKVYDQFGIAYVPDPYTPR